MSVDSLQRIIDRITRCQGCDRRNDCDLDQDCDIAEHPYRKRPKKRRRLVAPGSPDEPATGKTGHGEENYGGTSSDCTTLQTKNEKMVLKVARDISVLGADKMQHFNNRLVGRHGAACSEGNREYSGGKHENQYADPRSDRGACHRAHPIDPTTMVIKHGARHLDGENPSQLHKIRRRI